MTNAQQLSRETVMNLAEKSKLPLQDRHIKVLASGEEISRPNYPQTVIKHIRGQKSNRFPTSAEIKAALKKKFNVVENAENEPTTEKADFFSTGTYQQTELPICSSSGSKKTIDSSNTKTYDILWLPEDVATPDDMQAAFGEDTIVIQSTKDTMKMADDFDIKCLPSRIRANGDTIYTDEGVSALLNYDNNEEGELSPEMLEILKGE